MTEATYHGFINSFIVGDKAEDPQDTFDFKTVDDKESEYTVEFANANITSYQLVGDGGGSDDGVDHVDYDFKMPSSGSTSDTAMVEADFGLRLDFISEGQLPDTTFAYDFIA